MTVGDEQRAKEQIILRAAQGLFAERGFHNTTIDMIADGAGIGKGTVYLYFASKKDLLVTLFERRSAEMMAMLNEAVTARKSAADRLHALIRAHFDFYFKHKEFVRFVYAHLGELAEDMKRRVEASEQDVDGLLQNVLQQGIEEGLLRPLPLRSLQHGLQGLIHANAFYWAVGADEAGPEALADFVYDVFCHGAICKS